MSYHLGAVGPSVVTDMTIKLTGLSKQARDAADALARGANWTFQGSTMREWAETFKRQIDGMVGGLLATDAQGVPKWARNPKGVSDIADFIESEVKAQQANSRSAPTGPLSAVAIGAKAVAKDATAFAIDLIKASGEGAGEEGGIGAQAALGIGLGLAALVAVAYVIRTFK